MTITRRSFISTISAAAAAHLAPQPSEPVYRVRLRAIELEDQSTWTGQGATIRGAMCDLVRKIEYACGATDESFAEIYEEATRALENGATRYEHRDFSMPEEQFDISLS